MKKNRRININLEKNLYYHYKVQSSVDDYYEVYNKKEELLKVDKDKINLDNYINDLKNTKKKKSSIKPFNKDTIKISKDYKDAENLSERDIIPDLYEEEEDDIKSLEKSLERSIDKSFDKSYDKWYGVSLNDKINEVSNESNNLSNSNINESYNNNAGRNIINKLQEMFIEEVDENEEDDDKNVNLIDDENYNQNDK